MVFWVYCEGVFTTEAQSSQSSECFFNQKLFAPRPLRLRGAISCNEAESRLLKATRCCDDSLD